MNTNQFKVVAWLPFVAENKRIFIHLVLTLYYKSGNIVLEREVAKMKKKDFLEKIKHQFDITLEVERSAKNWIYVYIKRTEQYKILPYLERSNIRYEKHLNDGFYIVL